MAIIPCGETSTSGSMMSSFQYRFEAETSPGRRKFSSVESAIFWARPMPVSSIPPHQTGILWAWQRRSEDRRVGSDWSSDVCSSDLIAGQAEVLQRRERDILGASDASLQHSATPDGNIVGLAKVVDLQRFGESAHAADLDVDDAAGAGFNREGGAAHADDRFVEADRGAQFLLQARVVVDVVVPQRLLNHQQVELVELAQVLDLVERVSGISVAAQGDLGPARADPLQHVHVPARLDFDFDAAVASRQLDLDFFQKLLDRILNAYRNTAGDFAARAAEQLPQRQLLLRRLGVPESVFERGLGHAVGADFGEQRRALAGGVDALSQQRGDQILLQRRPGAFDPLAAVEGVLADDALAPSVGALAVHGDQQNAAAVGAPKARLEEMDEWHVNLAERDGFDFHGSRFQCPRFQGFNVSRFQGTQAEFQRLFH